MVSRGYLKIRSAYEKIKFDVKGKVCADIGCSTGGFTEFLLEMGAKKVYSIDIGKKVLHPSLRDKVILMEGIDAKKISKEMFDEIPEFATIDVSFSSSIPIIRNLNFIKELLVLCKPNFEVPRKYLKKGVLKDQNIAKLALKKVILNVSDIFGVKGITYSNIPGNDGNIEFFIYFQKGLSGSLTDEYTLWKEVEEAFKFFSTK